ncbi:MAG TPA: YkgJ family cysteine cluster protein [Candidatus Moranbacteria bacterium]|nr:YkgJ family cysteine cluster protein [Candidatus Moranbacteria bacterium]
MIDIKCGKCTICCGVECFNPVLFPFEEKRFKKYSIKIKTPFQDIFILKRKKDGQCIFQNKGNTGCRIYKKRPVDCRLFPICLKFDKKGRYKLIMDKDVCPIVEKGKSGKKKMEEYLKKHKIPELYGKAYYYYIHND